MSESSAAPAPRLASYVTSYHGSCYRGFAPGTHLGLPSHHLEFIICLDEPLRFAAMPDPRQPPGAFPSLAAGLHTGPALITHTGDVHSVSLELTPAGARTLLGVPAAALANTIVDLRDLLGSDATELAERLAAAPDWPGRFAVLDAMLSRRASRAESGHHHGGETAVGYAWQRIVHRAGRVRVEELATETGYSRRHLTKRFAVEYGLPPKQFARVVRFERSRRLLIEGGSPSLSEVAAACGYFDQAHLARDWNDLAGVPPSVWMAVEELPFVQADGAESP